MTRLRFNSVNIALPVQKFDIRCHVSLERSVPVMTEFAIRLLYTVGKMQLEQIRDYFGLSNHEVRQLISILRAENLVEEEGDYLFLSDYAITRFESSTGDNPRFTAIVERRNSVSFELLTFQYLPRDLQFSHSSCAVELKAGRDDDFENTIERAEKAYYDQFHDIERLVRTEEQKRAFGVYKIGEVTAGRRINLAYPVHFEYDTNDGRIEQVFDEQLDLAPKLRERLESLVADTVHQGRLTDGEAVFDFAKRFGDELIKRFIHPGGFDLARYISQVHVEKSVAYESEDTLPLFGSIYLPENVKFLSRQIRIGVTKYRESHKGTRIEPTLLWLAPASELWGRTKLLGDAIEEFTSTGRGALDNKRFGVPVVRQIEPRLVKRERATNGDAGILDLICCGRKAEFARYEVIVLPDVLAVGLCYVGIPSTEGSVAPIGFVTTNSARIKELESILGEVLSGVHSRNRCERREGKFEETSVSSADFAYLGS